MFPIAIKSAGVLGAGLTAIEALSSGNASWGTGAKVGIGLLTTFGGPVGFTYGIVDIGVGIYTGTTITNRIGSGVNKLTY